MGNNLHSFPFRHFRGTTAGQPFLPIRLSRVARWMSSFFSIFEKPRCERPFLRLCFARSFSSLRRDAGVLGQPTVTIYGRIYIRILFTSPRRKDGECMAGHRSAGLSEFGFNALGIHPLVVRLPRHSPSLRVLLCECKQAFTECPSTGPGIILYNRFGEICYC